MVTLLVADKRSEGVKGNYLGSRNQEKIYREKCCNIAYHFAIEEMQRGWKKCKEDRGSGKFRTPVLVPSITNNTDI